VVADRRGRHRHPAPRQWVGEPAAAGRLSAEPGGTAGRGASPVRPRPWPAGNGGISFSRPHRQVAGRL